ncbi:MAG TPA: hypothetical protein VK457_21795, partial [Chloroflexota bacterium]|nr:hypothetical protein [Chloroflexota bacterium]
RSVTVFRLGDGPEDCSSQGISGNHERYIPEIGHSLYLSSQSTQTLGKSPGSGRTVYANLLKTMLLANGIERA